MTRQLQTKDLKPTMATSHALSPAPSALRTSRLPQYLAWTLVVGLVLLPFLPLLALHARQLWLRPHFQFFPFALVGAAFLLHARLRGIGELQPGWPGLAVPMLAFPLALAAAAGWIYSPLLGVAAAMLMLLALSYAVGGIALVWRVLPVWIFLCLLLPPLNLDRDLVAKLQTFTTRWSSRILDSLGVLHVMAGNVVHVGRQALLVEEACSGIRSLYATLACTLFFIVWMGRPLVHAILLLVAAVFWLLTANVARIASGAYLFVEHDVNLLEGWPHEAFGLVLFVVVFLLVLSSDRLLLFLMPDRMFSWVRWPRSAAPAQRRETLAPARGIGWAGLALLLLASVAVAGLQMRTCWPTLADLGVVDYPVVSCLHEVEENILPKDWSECKLREFTVEERGAGHFLGQFSRRWSYRMGDWNPIVSLDYPYQAWHELSLCYEGQGWRILDRKHPSIANSDGSDDGMFVECRLGTVLNKHGYLYFCALDAAGRYLRPGGTDAADVPRDEGLLPRLQTRVNQGLFEERVRPGGVYQIQLFLTSYRPLTESEAATLRSLFHNARDAIRKRVVSEREKQS